MSKEEFRALLLQHDNAIRTLELSTANMLLLWRIVGAVALVALGVWLTAILQG